MRALLRIHGTLGWLAAAAVAGLVVLATPATLEAQASRTRPGGSSSSGHSSGGGSVSHGSSGSSSGSSASHGGGSVSHSPADAARTRPPSSSGSSPTVIQHDRRPVGFHHPHYSPHHTFYYGYYPYWGSPYWYWGPYLSGWGFDFGYYWPRPYPYYAGVDVYSSQVTPTMGALDVNVRPKRTAVYVNGQYVGVADQFDGWPRYLWLEEGSYQVSLYLDGFATVTRDVDVLPGVVINVGDRMQPGEAVLPQAPPRSTARRDARIAQEREQERAAARGDDWRDRVRADRGERAERGEPEAEAPYGDDQGGEARDARGEPGRVHLTVEPDDAAVYLDGRFLGTGRDLSRLGAGLIVDPGAHKLSVVRPGHQSRSVDFEVEAGQEIDVDVSLSAAAG